MPLFAPYLREIDAPVYLLDREHNVFVVDDSAFDYVALYKEREEQRQLRRSTWELGLLSDEEYWAEEGGVPGPMAYGYGPEEFWLELTAVTSGNAYTTLHGTVYNDWYQLLSKTNLVQPGEWTVEGLVQGAFGTNQTDFVPVDTGDITNMFFRGHHAEGFVAIGAGPDAFEPNAIVPAGRASSFTIYASPFTSDLTVYYRASGSASNGMDYTNLTGVIVVPASGSTTNLYIQPLEDSLIEGSESVIVTLVQTNGYLIYPDYQSASLWIKDSSTRLRVQADYPATAFELDGPPGVAAQNGSFQLSRYDYLGTNYPPLTVLYSLSGTAGNGVDYTNLTSSLTFTQDQQFATVTINPIPDMLAEGTETVILSLVPTNTYLIEPGFGADTITLADSSTTVEIVKQFDAVEPNPTSGVPKQTGQFAVNRIDSRNELPALTLSYQIRGTANNGVDHTNLTGTVTIPAGLPSANIFIEPLYDGELEGDETVTLTLTHLSDGYQISTDTNFASATVTIHDNMSSNSFQKVVNLTSPAGIDYHQPSNSVIVSRNNFISYNFVQLSTNALTTNVVVTNWSAVSGLSEEVKLFTVKQTANGFTNGEAFFSSGTGVGWISADGTVTNKNWCVLTNAFETNALPLRGGICMDETGGVFSNQLIVVTSTPNPDNTIKGVWRIWHNGSNGIPTLITKIATSHLEGALTLTNDATKWGPWAGKIVTGNEAEAKLFTIDASGMVTPYDSTGLSPGGIRTEDFDLVQTNQDLYVCDQNNLGAVYKLSHAYLTNFVGDLMITDAGEYVPPAKLFFLHWNNAMTNFAVRAFSCRMPDGSDGELEHVTFAPIGLPTLP